MKALKDLTFDKARILAGRELLRSLGTFISQSQQEISNRDWLEENVLLVLRCILTALADHGEDASMLAFSALRNYQNRSAKVAKTKASQKLDSMMELASILLAGNCAPSFSTTYEQEQATIDIANRLIETHSGGYATSILGDLDAQELDFGMPLWSMDVAITTSEAYLDGDIQIPLRIFDYWAQNRSAWSFWRDWYIGFMGGQPLDWGLQQRIAQIPDPIWDTGPQAVAEEIVRIRAEFEREPVSGNGASQPDPATESEKAAMAQRVVVNRDALAVSVAGLLEQLAELKERVRGLNHLDPDFREELLEFIGTFSGKLTELLGELPKPGDQVTDQQAGRLVLWMREYKRLLRVKLAHYASPENITEATVPTGIVLVGTGIGAMLGMPVAGSIAGGLIANTMKPGQAAKELTKPTKPDADGA